MSTLAEFLLARIDEDEKVARDADNRHARVRDGDALYVLDDDYRHVTVVIPVVRVLAECDAKRRIIARLCHVEWTGSRAVRDVVLAELALPYASHPDYQPEWRP